MSDLPNRIRELRLARGWSLERLGGAVGHSRVHVADLELGKRRLKLDAMEKFARALDVQAADLLRDEQNPFRLSASELRLIETWRAATHEQREIILRVAEAVIPPAPSADTQEEEA